MLLLRRDVFCSYQSGGESLGSGRSYLKASEGLIEVSAWHNQCKSALLGTIPCRCILYIVRDRVIRYSDSLFRSELML